MLVILLLLVCSIILLGAANLWVRTADTIRMRKALMFTAAAVSPGLLAVLLLLALKMSVAST